LIIRSRIAQPTICRMYRSRMIARCKQPSPVAIYVSSVVQT
jgi:hypothetical protein